MSAPAQLLAALWAPSLELPTAAATPPNSIRTSSTSHSSFGRNLCALVRACEGLTDTSVQKLLGEIQG